MIAAAVRVDRYPGDLVSGVLVRWLIDPGRAPSPADLTEAMAAIAGQLTAESTYCPTRPTRPSGADPWPSYQLRSVRVGRFLTGTMEH